MGKRDFLMNPHDHLRALTISSSVQAMKKPAKAQLLIAPAVHVAISKSENINVECNENFQAYVRDKLEKIDQLLMILVDRLPPKQDEAFDVEKAKAKREKIIADINAMGKEVASEVNKRSLMRSLNATIFHTASTYNSTLVFSQQKFFSEFLIPGIKKSEFKGSEEMQNEMNDYYEIAQVCLLKLKLY